MLVLSRKRNESVVINDQIVVTVIEVRGDKVRLGIQAPRDGLVKKLLVKQGQTVEREQVLIEIE